MAGPAFQISSRNTTSAVGRYPSTIRSYVSSSFSFEMDTGPKISSGVLNLDIRYSKALAPRKASFRRRATILLATPGGPSRKMLSPAMADSSERAMTCSFSYTRSLSCPRSCFMRSLFIIVSKIRTKVQRKSLSLPRTSYF